MKQSEWNEGLNNLDSDIIENYVAQKEAYIKKIKKPTMWLRYATVAATVCIVFGAVVMSLVLNRADEPEAIPEKTEETTEETTQEQSCDTETSEVTTKEDYDTESSEVTTEEDYDTESSEITTEEGNRDTETPSESETVGSVITDVTSEDVSETESEEDTTEEQNYNTESSEVTTEEENYETETPSESETVGGMVTEVTSDAVTEPEIEETNAVEMTTEEATVEETTPEEVTSEKVTEEETKPSKYTALEFSASDSGVVNHKLDIVLNKTTYVDTTSDTLKSVDFLGTEYNAKYEKSEKGYYYNENVDYFEVTDKYAHDFGINRNTGRIDVCEMYMVNYAQIKEGSQKLSRDECQEIALDILKQYVNLDEYVLTKAATGDLIEYKVYDFWFTRIIDGVKTNDKAYIVITEYGDLFNYIFTCLGEMKEAVAPTKEELSDMKVAIDAKVNSIYANVKKSYTVEYVIRDEYLVRLTDGSYAMEYVVDVNLIPNDPEGLKLIEKISLLVYV